MRKCVNLQQVIVFTHAEFALHGCKDKFDRHRNVKLRDVIHRARKFGGIKQRTGAVVEQPDIKALLIEALGETGLVHYVAFVVARARGVAPVLLRNQAECGLRKSVEHQQNFSLHDAVSVALSGNLRLPVARQPQLDRLLSFWRLLNLKKHWRLGVDKPDRQSVGLKNP